MPIKFNPLAGQFDLVGSGGGGGASYIDGEVQNFSALPETVGSPAVDSAYLCREPEGTWLLNRKPAGIYIRTANTGTRASDWTYAGEFPDVFNDANFVLYDNADSTKNLQFQLSGISTGTTRMLTAPDASGTIALLNDSSQGNITAADITSGSFGNISFDGKIGSTAGLPLKTGTAGVVEAGAFGTGAGEFSEGNHTHTQLHDKSHTMTDATSHTAGNHKVFYSDGSGQIQELALGNSGEVLTSNGASAAPSFAAKPVELVIACSDESTNLTTGTAKVTFRAPCAFLLTGVRASVNTAPTGSTLIVDINNGANSALSTKLSIDATEKTSATAATAAVIDTTYDDFSDDAEITIDIDQIGSTVAGKGLKVTLIGTRA